MASGLVFACSPAPTDSPSAVAQPSESNEEPTAAPSVVPQQERDTAQQLEMEGPTETLGIESLTVLATVELGDEFAGMEGYILRAREIVVAPGGQVAVHQHDARPGVAYIIEGEMVEYRNDQAGPIPRSAGEISTEKTGVVHWWKNESSENAHALVVDIVPKEE
jgi:quercetin dioxygenase-like cupin family protein